MAVPAVTYAAKSTADEHGSIPTQLADCRAAAVSLGRQIVGEYSDEAASAFKGNRGSGLSAAKDAAVGARAELWVQHSDRLARGDGITADHLAEVWFALRRHGVRIRSVQDDSNLEDAIRVVLIGERNHEDSKRKSAATRSGLSRRREKGLPVGAIPEGYRVLTTVSADGRPVTSRVTDSSRAPIVDRIFAMVEAGHTFGDVARALNADSLRTRRGKTWSTRAIRAIVLNEDYTGTTGYPALIEAPRWERIVGGLKHLSARQTGRRPSEPYMLRGVAFCGLCGQRLYTRTLASGRWYVCAAVREARGTCTAERIPAVDVEAKVIDHLEHFVGRVEDWIAARSRESDADRERFAELVTGQRAQLKQRQNRAARAHEQHERLLDAGSELADDALAQAVRLDAEAAEMFSALDICEQQLEDWPTPPQVDAALDFYNTLRDAIHGRVKAAQSVQEMNAALRSVLQSAALHVTPEGLHGRFTLKVTDDVLAGTMPTEVSLQPWPQGWPDTGDDELCFVWYGAPSEPVELSDRPSSIARFGTGVEIPPMVAAAG